LWIKRFSLPLKLLIIKNKSLAMLEKGAVAKNKELLTIKPTGGLFEDATYCVAIHACPDPMCGCGAGQMVVIKEENIQSPDDKGNLEYVIPIDVQKKIVRTDAGPEFYSKTPDGVFIQSVFSSSLTSADWMFLTEEFHEKKFRMTDQIDLNKFNDEFEFNREHLAEPTYFFAYENAFPYSVLYFGFGTDKYIINDHYCKDYKCDCTEMVLSVKKVMLEAQEVKIIGAYTYNYKTKEGKIQPGAASPDEATEIIKGFFAQYNDMDTVFEKRHKITQNLYKKAKLSFLKKNDKTIKNTGAEVKRNDPCPCGSGKKYKKCCLKK